jgi:alpha-L-arabinofuranosidase
LNDAAYMMSAEKNSDLVKMISYAPLLENVNKRDWEVNMIHFDSSRFFARATYYVQKLFAENQPSVNLPTAVAVDGRPPRPVAGRIGLGTWNTAAEFRDVRVESGGRVVYQSDFAAGPAGWAPPATGQASRGAWSVVEGAYRQSNEAVAWSYFGDAGWPDATLSVTARKISGAEGFLVSVGAADGRRVQWNVGGWNNRQHAVQVADAIVGSPVPGRIDAGRWYDVRIEVRDRTLRCFLDGQLVGDVTLPRIDTVLAIAGRDDRTGDVIVKVVNTGASPASAAITIAGAQPVPRGRATVLTSDKPEDENSFEWPTKIVPVTSPIGGVGRTFSHTFPPYSLTVMRLPTRPS